MTRLIKALPAMSTTQLVLLLDFYEGAAIRIRYSGLRADIRAALAARGVSEAKLALMRSSMGGSQRVR